MDFKAGGLGFVVLASVALLAVLLLALMMRSSSTGYRRFQEGRVTGISGRKGHGKTLYSVHELRRHVGQLVPCRDCTDLYHGRNLDARTWEADKPDQVCALKRGRVFHHGSIASNGNLHLDEKVQHLSVHVDGWDDLFTLPHATLIVVDEAHLWAPASQSQQLPKRVRWLLSQLRKLHLELIWVSQHEDRVSLGLRRQTDEIGICQKGYFKAMKVRFFQPEDARKRDVKPDWTFRYKVTAKLAASYNTYELLMPEASDTDDTHDDRVVAMRRQRRTSLATGDVEPVDHPSSQASQSA